MKTKTSFPSIIMVIMFLPQVILAQIVDILLVKDTSSSTLIEAPNFSGKKVLLSIIKPLDLMNSKYGVSFTVCTTGETGNPEYFTAELKPYNSWKTSKLDRYKDIKVFLSKSLNLITKISEKKNEERASNIYRNIHHIVHTGLKSKAEKRYVVIWSDFIESSGVDNWYTNYRNNPSDILTNYDKIVEKFETDLAWSKTPENTEICLISRGYTEIGIMATRWWKKYLISKGINTEIKASF
ncbi:hypothetical protein [Kordia sp.]|uniref:hypothetical protein n=1 Tax=Kordia sp. TaxID=1965332 RepID=UPI003D6AB72B